LESREELQKRIYETLKKDRLFLIKERKQLEKVLNQSRENATDRIRIILVKYEIK